MWDMLLVTKTILKCEWTLYICNAGVVSEAFFFILFSASVLPLLGHNLLVRQPGAISGQIPDVTFALS